MKDLHDLYTLKREYKALRASDIGREKKVESAVVRYLSELAFGLGH